MFLGGYSTILIENVGKKAVRNCCNPTNLFKHKIMTKKSWQCNKKKEEKDLSLQTPTQRQFIDISKKLSQEVQFSLYYVSVNVTFSNWPSFDVSLK